LISILTLIDAV